MVASQVRVLFMLNAIAVSLGPGAIAGGSPQAVAPISVRLALRAHTITLGEPVILDYAIANSTQSPVAVDMGEDEDYEAWLTVSVAPLSAARRAVAVRSSEPLRIGGTSVPPVIPVTPQYGLHRHIVVSRRLSFAGPGRYTVLVQSSIPYLIGGDAGTIRTLRPGLRPYTPPTGILNVKDTLTLVVKPQNVARLHKTARSLVAAATARGRNVEEARTAIQALFTMPPKFVADEWLALVQNEQLGYQIATAVIEMARTKSPQAVDILAKLQSDAKRPTYVTAPARAGLLHMWQQGDLPLKHQIANHFIRSEGRMPKAESITSPVD